MMAPLQAVYRHVPRLPQVGPEDPGPFAFASEERVTRILREAGYAEVAMEACDIALDIAIGRGLDAAADAALEIGPSARALDGHPPEVARRGARVGSRIADALRARANRAAAGIDLDRHRTSFVVKARSTTHRHCEERTATKQSIVPQADGWIASLRSQ